VQKDRQLEKIDEELSIEVLKPKEKEMDGSLVVKVTIQRTLVFSATAEGGQVEQGHLQLAEDQFAIV
jgi:hypothetical protein